MRSVEERCCRECQEGSPRRREGGALGLVVFRPRPPPVSLPLSLARSLAPTLAPPGLSCSHGTRHRRLVESAGNGTCGSSRRHARALEREGDFLCRRRRRRRQRKKKEEVSAPLSSIFLFFFLGGVFPLSQPQLFFFSSSSSLRKRRSHPISHALIHSLVLLFTLFSNSGGRGAGKNYR